MRVEERDAGLTSRESEISGLDVGVAHLDRGVALRKFDGLGAEGGDDLRGFLRGGGLGAFELGDLGLQLGELRLGGLEGFGQRSDGSVLDGGFHLEGLQFGRGADGHLLDSGAEVVAFSGKARKRGGGLDELLFDGHASPAEIGNLGRGDDGLFDLVFDFLFGLFDDFRHILGGHDFDAQGGHGLAAVGAVVDEQVDHFAGVEAFLDYAGLEGGSLFGAVIHD